MGCVKRVAAPYVTSVGDLIIAAAVVVERVLVIDAAVELPRVLAAAIGLKIFDAVHVPIALAVLLGGLILGCFLGRLRGICGIATVIGALPVTFLAARRG